MAKAKKVAKKAPKKSEKIIAPKITPVVRQQPFTPQVVLKGYDGKNREVLLTQISIEKFVVTKEETNYTSKSHLHKEAQKLFDIQVTCTQN